MPLSPRAVFRVLFLKKITFKIRFYQLASSCALSEETSGHFPRSDGNTRGDSIYLSRYRPAGGYSLISAAVVPIRAGPRLLQPLQVVNQHQIRVSLASHYCPFSVCFRLIQLIHEPEILRFPLLLFELFSHVCRLSPIIGAVRRPEFSYEPRNIDQYTHALPVSESESAHDTARQSLRIVGILKS